MLLIENYKSGLKRVKIMKRNVHALYLLILVLITMMGFGCAKPKDEDQSLYVLLLQKESYEEECGDDSELLLLDETLNGTVTHEGWEYFKFAATEDNDATFLVTLKNDGDIDLTVGYLNAPVPDEKNLDVDSLHCPEEWEFCSRHQYGYPETIDQVEVKKDEYRCLGVYGTDCSAADCTFTINATWYVK